MNIRDRLTAWRRRRRDQKLYGRKRYDHPPRDDEPLWQRTVHDCSTGDQVSYWWNGRQWIEWEVN